MSSTAEYGALTADRVNGGSSDELNADALERVDLDRLAQELYRLMASELLQEHERGLGAAR